eukprot:4442317-Prymnesium_polylepis.1
MCIRDRGRTASVESSPASRDLAEASVGQSSTDSALNPDARRRASTALWEGSGWALDEELDEGTATGHATGYATGHELLPGSEAHGAAAPAAAAAAAACGGG